MNKTHKQRYLSGKKIPKRCFYLKESIQITS